MNLLAPRILMVVVGALLVDVPAAAAAVQLPEGFWHRRAVWGFEQPVSMAFLPDGRLLVTERTTRRVRMVVGGWFASTDPVARIDSVDTRSQEEGLLGIAVDPGWPLRPYVYLSYDALDSTMHIVRYRAAGDLVAPTSGHLTLDPGSRYVVLAGIPDSSGEHNGGTLRFGPDGMLYASLGDDSRACAAQDTVSLRGLLLRLRVDGLPDGPGGPPPRAALAPPDNPFAHHPDPRARLVWAIGFRNPFRFHIDPSDGAIFVADVGTHLSEEIDRVEGPGRNFGWPYLEGSLPPGVICARPAPTGLTGPVYTYNRDTFLSGTAAVSLGVYRTACGGCGYPAAYEGSYFFGDFVEGVVRRLERVAGEWRLAAPVPGQPSSEDWARGFEQVTDGVIGPDGALWLLRLSDAWDPASGALEVLHPAAHSGAPRAAADPAAATFHTRPSPARGPVDLEFRLAAEAAVRLELFDLGGRRIDRLLDGAPHRPGRYRATWNPRAAGLPAGLYLARLTAGGARLERRILVVP